MDLILDTNALLWLLAGDDRLSKPALQAIEQASTLYVSEASLWEISIKVSIGKLNPIPELGGSLEKLGFKRLGLDDKYLKIIETLPFEHKDPFDRLIIAQAIAESVPVLTSDKVFSRYNVQTVAA